MLESLLLMCVIFYFGPKFTRQTVCCAPSDALGIHLAYDRLRLMNQCIDRKL
jgi:hypothetical protein